MSADRILLRGLAPAVGDLTGPEAVLLDGGRIAALGSEARAAKSSARTLDGRGLIAVPGFIELQHTGIAGADFTSNPIAMWQVSEALSPQGVTAFLPTIISSPPGTVETALQAWRDGSSTAPAAVPLGLHVEGPFISRSRAVAHPAAHIRPLDLGEIRDWLATGQLHLLTLAPELPDALAAIELVVGAGAIASIGHTDADAVTTVRAIDAGVGYATHLFNAMPPLAHRAPGAVGALLADERVSLGLIADGEHLDPLIVDLVARLAPGRVSLVTDAVSAHRLGDRDVIVSNGAARLADGTLAGSVATLDACVRRFASITGSARAAVDAVTALPARLLGDPDRGRLTVGARADVVLLDRQLRVCATIAGGSVAYLAEGMARPSR